MDIFGDPIEVEIPDGYGVYKPFLIGFILELSGRQYKGVRIIDSVKKQLVKFVNTLETDDKVFVYHPNNDSISDHGMSVAQISDYDCPYPFLLIQAFRITLQVLGSEDRDYRKHIFYITDQYRVGYNSLLEGVIVENGCKLWAFGLGRCDSCLGNIIDFKMLEDPEILFEEITKRING